MKRLLVLAAVVSAAVATMAAGPAYAILDGKPDRGEHPHVGAVLSHYGLCTGTRISMFRVLTAAHCMPPGTQALVVFNESINGGPPTWTQARPGRFIPHPRWCPGCSGGVPGIDTHDVAIIQTFGPLPGPYGELPPIGYVDTLTSRQTVTSVGYGIRLRAKDVTNEFGDRYQVTSSLIPSNGVISDEYVKLSAAKGGTCYGDSGGPSFIGNTIAAITAFTVNGNCAGLTYSQRLDLPSIRSFIDSVPDAPARP